MFMRKIKFKILILLMCFISINQYSLNVFADTPSDDIPSVNTPSTENTNSPTNKNNSSTVLDGEIGEWDPTLDDNPDFNNPELDEIDGHIPTEDEYYTISVTVPLNMEFMVMQDGESAFGKFFSPTYTVKNNGSKNISVKIKSFEPQSGTNDQDTTTLYIDRLNPGDGKTQMELKLGVLNDLDLSEFNKEIDLTQIDTLSQAEQELFNLEANQVKKFKFTSTRWEIPKYESDKENAKTNFNANFEFSIVQKSTDTEI